VLRILGDNQPVSLTQSRPINRLDVQMYISKIPQLVKHMIKRVLVQTYQTRSITFHSSFESINNALMITNRKLRDFIFILPGRGRTTIVSSRYGSIHKVSHVPIGEDFLVRTISTALNRPHHDIRSRIQLRKKNRHHPAGMREMNIALDEISRRWLQSTYKEIESMTRGNSPQTVFVSMTDSNTGKVFGEFASRLKTYESKLQISNINTEHFSEYIENHRLPDYRLTMSVLGTCGY
jgi:cell division ATPase FtsA